MIYEFALEPELVAQWCDRREYLFFKEKFGVRSRRIVSAYPKKWKRFVWDAFRSGPSASNQNAQMRMTEVIQHLWQNSIKRPSTFPEIVVWLERAEAEHAERPFRAILATHNPRQKSFVIPVNRLIESEHELWKIPDSVSTPRKPSEISEALSPLIRLCQHLLLIDPYFDPNKNRFRQTLKAILSKCDGNVCGIEHLNIELHTSIDRFFKDWERSEHRDSVSENSVYENFVRDCENRIPDLFPQWIQLKIVVWKQRYNGEKLHNRYLLTDMYGVMFGTGSDAASDPDSIESDDIVLLEEGQYLNRYSQYAGTTPAFDLVGKPFQITGRKS
jgi:hypothetical protein